MRVVEFGNRVYRSDYIDYILGVVIQNDMIVCIILQGRMETVIYEEETKKSASAIMEEIIGEPIKLFKNLTDTICVRVNAINGFIRWDEDIRISVGDFTYEFERCSNEEEAKARLKSLKMIMEMDYDVR